MNLRDTAERLFWTVLAAFLGGLSVGGVLNISTRDAAVAAAATAGMNFLLLVARTRLSVLPDPGEGLPSLPTNDRGVTGLEALGIVLLVIVVLVVLF